MAPYLPTDTSASKRGRTTVPSGGLKLRPVPGQRAVSSVPHAWWCPSSHQGPIISENPAPSPRWAVVGVDEVAVPATEPAALASGFFHFPPGHQRQRLTSHTHRRKKTRRNGRAVTLAVQGPLREEKRGAVTLGADYAYQQRGIYSGKLTLRMLYIQAVRPHHSGKPRNTLVAGARSGWRSRCRSGSPRVCTIGVFSFAAHLPHPLAQPLNVRTSRTWFAPENFGASIPGGPIGDLLLTLVVGDLTTSCPLLAMVGVRPGMPCQVTAPGRDASINGGNVRF